MCATFSRLARYRMGDLPATRRACFIAFRGRGSYDRPRWPSLFSAQRRAANFSGIGLTREAALTSVWEAPRRAYELAQNLAAGDRAALDELWKGLTSQDQADVVIALGAQARYAARAVRIDHGTSVAIPGGIWDRITCSGIREFAIDSWGGVRCARVPSALCEHCLRAAADLLAELHLAALAASGVPRSMLVEVCARAAAESR